MEDLNLKEISFFKNIDTNYVLDSLTQVICRQYILDIANKLIADKVPFTLFIIDLDNFKQVNDSFGHLTGDFILKNVSQNILNLLKKTAYVGRFGGDEFIVLVPNVTGHDEVHQILEKIYDRGKIFRKYYNDGTRDIYVTSTCGSASYPTDATDFEGLFNKADKALYRGKVKGRNCYIIYVESMHGNIIIQ